MPDRYAGGNNVRNDAASSPHTGSRRRTQREADRDAEKPEGLAQAVDEVTLVAFGDAGDGIAEQNEERRTRLGLGDVADLDAPPGGGRRRRRVDDGASQRLSRPVEMRMFQTASVATTASMSLSRWAPVRPETGITRVPRSCGRRRSASARNSRALSLLLSIEVPFVEPDDERPALLLDEIGEGEVLLLERDRGVEQEHHDFREPHRPQRVGYGELLDLADDARPAAQTRGVEDLELAPAPLGVRARCCRG